MFVPRLKGWGEWEVPALQWQNNCSALLSCRCSFFSKYQWNLSNQIYYCAMPALLSIVEHMVPKDVTCLANTYLWICLCQYNVCSPVWLLNTQDQCLVDVQQISYFISVSMYKVCIAWAIHGLRPSKRKKTWYFKIDITYSDISH